MSRPVLDPLRQKAEKFDQIILDLKFQFDFWAKLYRQRPIPYYEGRLHAYAAILWYAGYRHDEQVAQIASTLKADAAACARVGE